MFKLRKISKHEIYSDITLFIAAVLIATGVIYIFDIHWSFYPGNQILPPSKHIFTTPEPYYIGVPIGTIAIFIILKLILFAFVEEERFIEEGNGKTISIKVKKGKAFIGR